LWKEKIKTSYSKVKRIGGKFSKRKVAEVIHAMPKDLQVRGEDQPKT